MWLVFGVNGGGVDPSTALGMTRRKRGSLHALRLVEMTKGRVVGMT